MKDFVFSGYSFPEAKFLADGFPLQTQYTRAMSSSRMLRAFPRNPDASGTVSISELSSRLNTPWDIDVNWTG
jgi:hypothetical protein